MISKDLPDGSYKIGRAEDCSIVLNSNKVSKYHALLIVKGNRAAILDTNSSNGVFVNGILIKKQLLNTADKIEMGDHTFSMDSGATPRRKIELFSTDGSAAFAANPEENPEGAPDFLLNSPSEAEPEITVNKMEQLLNLVDGKILYPFFELVKVIDYRFLMAMILVTTIGISAFFSVIPVLSWGRNITKQESLKRGQAILKQVVRENYRILSKTNDTSLLTVAAAEGDKDMLEVYILDAKTKSVLAPTKYLSKSINDPYMLLALGDLIDEGKLEAIKDRGDGTFVLAESIPYYGSKDSALFPTENPDDPATATTIVVAYFKIPQSINGIYEPLAIAGLVSLLLALVSFFLLHKMISQPIKELHDQLDTALKGDNIQMVCNAKFPELEALTTVINFSITKMKSAGGGMAAVPAGIPGGIDADNEEMIYLKSIEEFCLGSTDGILVLDISKKVKYVGPILGDLMGLRSQYAVGQNIGDACRDGSFSGTVIDMCERVVSSLGETQTASLDINGAPRNLTAVGHRLSNGEVSFILITVKMNA